MDEKSIIEFGSAKARPGERGTGFIKVGELCDGSSINIPVIILNGKNDGTKLLIFGLEDGDEYPATLGALELANDILPKMLSHMNGSVVLLPATNIGAFRGNPFGGGQRNSPLDIDQGAALARLYPGNPYGRHSAQLAYHITKVKNEYDPDVLIRLHGAKQIYGWDRVIYRKCPAGSTLDNLARACVTKPDTMVAFPRDSPTIEGDRTLRVTLETNGGENGVGNGFNGVNVRDGILNVMRHLKMIPGEEIKVDKIQYVKTASVIHDGYPISHRLLTTRGGFFKPLVDIKERVQKGQVVGEISNFFGEIVEEIKAVDNGIVLGYYCEAPHIGSGQWRVFEIAVPTECR